MRIFSNRNRPVHLGPFPLERVARAAVPPDLSAVSDAFPAKSDTALGRIVNDYVSLFEQFRAEDPAPERAPYPQDARRLANELKANCYFLDASLVGCCEIPDSAWTVARIEGHRYALAILVEFGRAPDPGNLAAEWIRGSEYDCALLRAAEIAIISASFLRRLGFAATAHTRACTEVSHARILVAAGVARCKDGKAVAPFIGTRFASCIVTTPEPLASDSPLQTGIFDGGLGWWFGAGGTDTWWERWFAARRWIVRLDDAIGNGSINPAKTWWTDLEIVEGEVLKPKGTNRRGLALDKAALAPKVHQIAYYPAHVMPPPDAKAAVPVDRKAALAVRPETPAEARARQPGGVKS